MNDVVKKAGREGQEKHGEEHGPAGVKPISRFSKFKGMIAGLGLATAIVHGCSDNETQPPTIPPQCTTEGGAGTECTDGGSTTDSGAGGDGGTTSDGGSGGKDGGNGGMDAGHDGGGGMDSGTGGMDSGTGGMDSGTGGDGGTDGGMVLCPAAVLDAPSLAVYSKDNPVIVGNVAVTFRGLSGGLATFDVTCGGTIVTAGDNLIVGLARDYDLGGGKILTITVNSANMAAATATASVHN
jgi:hypothetical protein